jgi:hypothetical protein
MKHNRVGKLSLSKRRKDAETTTKVRLGFGLILSGFYVLFSCFVVSPFLLCTNEIAIEINLNLQLEFQFANCN